MRRRFELADGATRKFWEIETVEDTYVTWRGIVGEAGIEVREQTRSSRYCAEFDGSRRTEAAIYRKLRRGYVEVYGEAPLVEPPNAPHDPDGPRAGLELELSARPEDYDRWSIYADTLASAGDPRGELVAIGVALARGHGDATRLRLREDELLRRHAREWFGRFATDPSWRECLAWTMNTGFLARLYLRIDKDHLDLDVGEALAHALDLDGARFLRQLELELPPANREVRPGGWIDALAQRWLPSLRRLKLHTDYGHEFGWDAWPHVGDVGALWTALPSLEHLHLEGAAIGLGTPRSTRLRGLELVTTGLPAAAGEALARAELPALERLVVWFGERGEGGECDVDHARAILENPSLVELRHLALANAEFGDALARVVTEAALPPKLEHLDLGLGTMTDAGAALLLERADALAGLAVIDLRENCLSRAMCARLRAALPNANTGDDDREQKSAPLDELAVTYGEGTKAFGERGHPCWVE